MNSGNDSDPAGPTLGMDCSLGSEESSLLDSARAGSEDAFCKLVRLHQTRVRAYLHRIVRFADVADDLAQDVFVAGFRTLHTYRGEVSLASWFLGIARHRALRYWRDVRRRESREAVVAGWQTNDLERDAADEEAFDREVAALRGCLEELPPENRELVNEHYFEKHSLVSLARVCGKTEGALRVALFRIRSSLRRCVEGKLAT